MILFGYSDYSTVPAASGLTAIIDNGNSTYGVYTTYNASPDYAQQIPVSASAQTNGMVTWTETKVLNTSNYEYAVMLYDDKARTVQVKSKNAAGGGDVITTQCNWAGRQLVGK